MNTAQTRNMLIQTLTNGGGTFAHNGARVDIDSGFLVGGAGRAFRLPVDGIFSQVDTVSAMVARVPADCFVGTWTYDGLLYIDATDHVDDFWTAFDLALTRDQIALYDAGAGESFFLSA